MFSNHLSVALRRICDARNLSYEQASAQCGCSARHFGSIIRRHASPTLGLLERMCTAFGRTPDQLLGVSDEDEEGCRRPLAVREVRQYPAEGGPLRFPVCPCCGCSLEREYQSYCDRCGQKLEWGELWRAASQKDGSPEADE